ncbi:hypothetical protein BDQ17DRAFT_1332496 [Cyathus striatus]|nr:hypothetical protein BDQ17DRAFT_1332496 [Cyathus striatus]
MAVTPKSREQLVESLQYIGKGRAGTGLSFVHVSPPPQLVRTPIGVSMGAGTYSINAASATAPIPTAIEAHGNRYTIQAFLPATNEYVESNIFEVTGGQLSTPTGITYTLPVTTATQHTIPVEISATTVEATAETSVGGATTITIAHPITSTVIAVNITQFTIETINQSNSTTGVGQPSASTSTASLSSTSVAISASTTTSAISSVSSSISASKRISTAVVSKYLSLNYDLSVRANHDEGLYTHAVIDLLLLLFDPEYNRYHSDAS